MTKQYQVVGIQPIQVGTVTRQPGETFAADPAVMTFYLSIGAAIEVRPKLAIDEEGDEA